MSRPSPEPSPIALVVKKGSKIRGRTVVGNAWSVVDDVHLDARFILSRHDVQLTALGSLSVTLNLNGVNGVIDEVGPNLVELTGVAEDHR